jgi:DNA/RNA endonuclease G (NUC1)
MSKFVSTSVARSRLLFVTASISALALISVAVVFAAISLSTAMAYTQNFDAMGVPATATAPSTLPTDFKADALTTVRTVGTFSAAGTTTARAGGADLATNAANGIYNFGSGTATLGGSDRAVGFLASGTATTSGNVYAQLVNSTGGDLSGLQISYNVEKYRNGTNAAGFRIQMFYSPDGNTWTSAGNNFLTSFVADANNNGFATAPGPTVPVNNQLSTTIPNGSNFYLAWNYSVSSGSTVTNAQALAIDDISILGIAGPINPTGVGVAIPSALLAGNQTLLTVTVTPGSNPASTGLSVSGDLGSIGGSATQQFFDDGTNGDVVVGNNIFSYSATVSVATTPGAKTIPFSITDAQSRSGSGNISLTVALHDPAEHMVMGNPSGAVTDVNLPLNYLMMKPQYALSYNNDKGTPNWTSWHLDSSWTTGVADRQNDFRSDDTLPPSFNHVSNDYQFAIYGFQRGHMCPSADRTSSVADNSATFLMTNMVPQAPGNNEGPWASLETYIRNQLSGTVNELYIISGGTGVGGTSSTGHWDSIIDTAGNTVTVPHVTWKVVMVLPNATGDDVSRVSTSTRTFAVIMPNDDNIRPDQWEKYLATVDQVEALSSYDFYSNVPTAVQDVIEARLDVENDAAPITSDQTVTTVKDQAVAVTLSATDFNVNNTFTYTIVGCTSNGSLSDSIGTLCSPTTTNGNPSRTTNGNLIYTPDPNYVGQDLFTFKANDGALDSNVSTVTITVTEPPSCSVLNNGVFNNGEWIIQGLDSSILEAPYEVRINGNLACSTKLLAFANRVSDTSRFPQVFDIYSSGYIRMKAGADPSPPLPFGQSLVLGPAIVGTSTSFPAETFFLNPQLQRVDIDSSQLHPDGTGTLLISVTANDSGLAPNNISTNQIMNQTWGITLHEPTNEETRIDVAGTFTFTETAVPDATRTGEFQSFKLLQISSMFIDSARHDVDAFRFRSATGPVTLSYDAGFVNTLLPPTPSALDPSTGILDSLHTDDVGQPNGNTPSYRILLGTTTGPMSGPITPRAFITPSQDVNKDNLGLWLHQQPGNVIPQGTSGSINYTVVATTDPMPGDTAVQFSATNYGVTEDCTTITITVNRVGDTSGPATVNYSTSDVTASERRDYLTATGRLSFAPGETSKSFAVLINEDSYVEGPETFNVDLSNPAGAGLGAPPSATVTITDDAIEPATNVIDDPGNFVCQHYHDFLNRHPDQAGWDFWTNQITSCGTDAQCIEVKRINVSAAFFLSIEFQETGYLVERIYKAAYGDAIGTSTLDGVHQLAVPVVRFNEFLADTQEIGQGVIVNQPGWEQILENNKQAFTLEFVQRSRFTSVFPASMTPAQFVDTLNMNAGNPLSQSERDQLVTSLTSGAITRAQVLRAVAEDSDLNSAEFNRAFVLIQYFGYLRRNPNDPQDSDYTGYDFWLRKLSQFNGNFVNAEMVKAFIVSAEYRQRFGP